MPEARIDYSIDIKANGIAELRRLREEDAQLKDQLGSGARAAGGGRHPGRAWGTIDGTAGRACELALRGRDDRNP